jgi:hypothetical protein
MGDEKRQAVLMTPQTVAAYVKGAPAQGAEFDFLIGEWDAQTTRYAVDGSVAFAHTALWRARHLHEKRIVFDDYIAYGPDGAAIGSFATLRTYCEDSGQWEMTFLVAQQRILLTSFVGRRVGSEMHLHASGRDLEDKPVEARVRFYNIAGDSFDWEQELSVDGGASWTRDVVIRARRRKV